MIGHLGIGPLERSSKSHWLTRISCDGPSQNGLLITSARSDRICVVNVHGGVTLLTACFCSNTCLTTHGDHVF